MKINISFIVFCFCNGVKSEYVHTSRSHVPALEVINRVFAKIYSFDVASMVILWVISFTIQLHMLTYLDSNDISLWSRH